MRHPLIIAMVASACVVACQQRAPSVENATPAATPTLEASDAPQTQQEIPAITCPHQDFAKFFKIFQAETSVQKSFTNDPYVFTWYDPQALEADPHVDNLSMDKVTFPVIMSSADMEKHGVTMKILKKSGTWYEVSTQGPGSGFYTMNFNFRHMRGCWYLTDSTDAST